MKDYFHEALAFSRHMINLEFDEETMKPEKATGAPRNAGIDPSTMKMKQWYQGKDRVSDKKAPTGTDSASFPSRERIESDEKRLAIIQGDMPPPVLPIGDFEKKKQCRNVTRKGCVHAKAWLDCC